MAGALTKLLRLAAARGPLALLRAAWGATADACRERHFRVVAAPAPDCGWRTAWRKPTRRRFEQSLRRRLGLPPPEFRRRAEFVEGIGERLPDTPVTDFRAARRQARARRRLCANISPGAGRRRRTRPRSPRRRH